MVKKTLYLYVGTKKQMEDDLLEHNWERFITLNQVKREYGSIKKMEEVHGKRYVHRIKFAKI